MNRTSDLTDDAIREWASRQLADYDQVRPGTLFADGHTLTEHDAYRVQSEVAQLRRRRGEIPIGYKVGCTSQTIRKQLGIDHSICGHLYDSEQHDSGVTLSRARFANLAIEGELAIELSRQPSPTDFEGNLVPLCVSRVFPVIELHNHVIRGNEPSAGELIANNAIHAGFVTGDGIAASELRDSTQEPSLMILGDGQAIDECEGVTLIQTIHTSLLWLMDWLRTRNETLAAGQIVLTGSIPSLIPIPDNCCVRVESPPIGSVEATFED